MQGVVEAIYVTREGGGQLAPRESVEAVEGRGLEGDRYGGGAGTFSNGEPKQQVTLIEAEAIEAVHRDYGLDLTAAETRRNILTRGIALNHLVGRTFRVGAAVCEGLELCEPCGYLESKTREGIRKALLHRGGLRAAVLSGGRIAPGDAIETQD